MSDKQRQVKSFENGHWSTDLSQEVAEGNPWLKNYGHDRYTYHTELYEVNNNYWYKNEAKLSHGYPLTLYLQAGIIYGCGLYTAKEQGIVKKGVVLSRFWRAHYFDWISFLRRSSVYGIAGGVLLGTIAFGNPELAMARVYSKYQYYMIDTKIDNNGTRQLFMPRMN